MGVSQVFALLPTYLRELGVPEADRLAVRRPVQLAGVRARAAPRPAVGRLGGQVQPQGRHRPQRLVEVVVFGLAALAREPWQMAVAVLLIGFQLGQHGGDAGGHPGRRAAPPGRDDDRAVRRGRARRVRGRAGARSACSSTARAGPISGVFAALGGASRSGRRCWCRSGRARSGRRSSPWGPCSGSRSARCGACSATRTCGACSSCTAWCSSPTRCRGRTRRSSWRAWSGRGLGLASAIGLVMGVASLVGALASPARGLAGRPRGLPAGAARRARHRRGGEHRDAR